MEEELACIVPTSEMLKTDENLKILDTHEWTVSSSVPQGEDGILIKIYCKNCGLQRISIISDIKDSAERARVYREKLQLLV
jgi:hypothetical protein